jgi:hypothetical protein
LTGGETTRSLVASAQGVKPEDVRPLGRFDRGLNPLVGLKLCSTTVPRKEELREEEYEVPPLPSAPHSPFLEGRAQPAGTARVGRPCLVAKADLQAGCPRAAAHRAVVTHTKA